MPMVSARSARLRSAPGLRTGTDSRGRFGMAGLSTPLIVGDGGVQPCDEVKKPGLSAVRGLLAQIVRVRVVEEVEAQGQILPLELGGKWREGARLINAPDGGAI